MSDPAPDNNAAPAPAVRFSHVDFRFENSPVIRDATFDIFDGESICLIGPNGGGKTTLFRLMLGLLKPYRGAIEILGEPPRKACPRLGYMPQQLQFDPRFPVTARDIVLMGRVNRALGGPYPREDKEAALHALERTHLAHVATHPFSKLSGGQRQRVLIARALVCDPRILLLDEPTANVDLAVEQQFLDTIESLKGQLTIVTISHDLSVVAHLAKRVLCVNQTVHTHAAADLTGNIVRDIFSGERRIAHEQQTLHEKGDHSHCNHH